MSPDGSISCQYLRHRNNSIADKLVNPTGIIWRALEHILKEAIIDSLINRKRLKCIHENNRSCQKLFSSIKLETNMLLGCWKNPAFGISQDSTEGSNACLNMPDWTCCACETHYGDTEHHLGMHNTDNWAKTRVVNKADHDPSICLHPQVFRTHCLHIIGFTVTFSAKLWLDKCVIYTKLIVMGLHKPVKNTEPVK